MIVKIIEKLLDIFLHDSGIEKLKIKGKFYNFITFILGGLKI